jgi:O-antigen/teichoic acid export membrane protein
VAECASVSEEEMGSGAPPALQSPIAFNHRRERQQRVFWAWGTSVFSKIAATAVQLLAVPLAFRALGEGGYAAYAAVTASAGIFAIMNLGLGGSLVTPLAEAAAKSDERKQSNLVQAGLVPLVLSCLVGLAAALPLAAFLPLHMLLGRIGTPGSMDLRIAVLIAFAATMASIPLSAVQFLRQAYQEIHLTNLFGMVANLYLCVALLLASARSTSVAVFVTIFVLAPPVAYILNFIDMFVRRRYLFCMEEKIDWKESRHLVVDGIRFLGASFSHCLVYQWPVYYIARQLPASVSSQFAICIQAVILMLGVAIGFLQPLWSMTADAVARGDHEWLQKHIRYGRGLIISGGVAVLLVWSFFGETILRLWMRKPLVISWQIRGLMGAYILLALWEYYHFIMAMGFGRLREATTAAFQRALVYAIAMPFLVWIGGVPALWCGLSLSILLWTGWRLPALLQPKAEEQIAASCG